MAAKLATLGAADAAGTIWSQQIRFLGVGAMLVGGMWTLVSLRGSLLAGIRSGLAATRRARAGGAAAEIPATERDLPMKYVLSDVVLASLPLMLMYHSVVGSFTDQRADDAGDDRAGVPVLLGVGLHGRPGRQHPTIRCPA